jgi:hypothetical protein
MSNPLKPDHGRDTSVHVLDMGARRRTSVPYERKGGISLPVDYWEWLGRLADRRSDAFAVMGGENKQSISDELEEAVDLLMEYVDKTYGELPEADAPEADRKAYSSRMAVEMAKELKSSSPKSSKPVRKVS